MYLYLHNTFLLIALFIAFLTPARHLSAMNPLIIPLIKKLIPKEQIDSTTDSDIEDQQAVNLALIEGVDCNDIDIVQEALINDANPDTLDILGETPLLQAALRGSTQIVQELIDNHATVNIQDKAGCTPLINAAIGGHADIVASLIEADADPFIANNNGIRPLDIATPEIRAIITSSDYYKQEVTRHNNYHDQLLFACTALKNIDPTTWIQ